MEEKDLELFAFGIFVAFYCYNDEKVNEMKVWFGKWVKEHGGSERVWEEYRDSLPEDMPKGKVIEALEECVKVAVEKGEIKNDARFKRDYRIVVSADNNDNVYCQVSRKGEFVTLTEEDNKIVLEMIGELYNKMNRL